MKEKETNIEQKKKEIEEKLHDYKCIKCGTQLKAYSYGLGCECRCPNCGYKDPCCE